MSFKSMEHSCRSYSEIQTQNLALGYGERLVIKNLNITFPPNQVSAIIGPNGCGKSTLLSGISRVLKPLQGQVLINGQSVHQMPTKEVAQLLALLPQEAHAPQGMSVKELIHFGRQPYKGFWSRWTKEDEQIVQQAIALAALEDLVDRPLDSISGGQRQRAWIAMTIAQNTPILLLDETTSALDLGHQIEVFELIRQLAKQGKTIIMVVHDIVSACRFADHIVALKDGQVYAAGKPQNVMTSALIHQLYGVHCEVVSDPFTGCIMLADIQSTLQQHRRLNAA